MAKLKSVPPSCVHYHIECFLLRLGEWVPGAGRFPSTTCIITFGSATTCVIFTPEMSLSQLEISLETSQNFQSLVSVAPADGHIGILRSFSCFHHVWNGYLYDKNSFRENAHY